MAGRSCRRRQRRSLVGYAVSARSPQIALCPHLPTRAGTVRRHIAANRLTWVAASRHHYCRACLSHIPSARRASRTAGVLRIFRLAAAEQAKVWTRWCRISHSYRTPALPAATSAGRALASILKVPRSWTKPELILAAGIPWLESSASQAPWDVAFVS